MISVDMTCNVDFADIKKATLQSGCAVMGVGVAKGENRALEAVKQAVTSPLLNNNDIYGARSIIVSVLSDPEDEVTIDEQGVIMDFLADMAGGEENDEYWMKWGEGTDENLTDGEVRVTVIATGYANDCFMTRKAGTAIKIARKPNGENVVIDGAADANEGDVAPMTEEEKQQLEAKKRKAAEVNKKIDILYGNENQTETFTRFDYSKLSEPRTVALKDMTEEVLSNIENTTAYARRTASVN
jgi:cell division protein FtsZ